MTDQTPPTDLPNRLTTTKWAVDVVRSLSLQNLMAFAMLVMIAAPAWFSWRFMNDAEFRHEFLSSSEILNMEVPCLVIRSNRLGDEGDRYTVGTQYDTRNRMEFMIAIRSYGVLSDQEVTTACGKVHEHANMIRLLIRDAEARAAEGK